MYGYIYKTTNLINGKIYIGQKASSLFLGEKYLGSGRYLNNAVNKYGRECFKVELLEWCEDSQQLNLREKYWIAYYDSRNFQVGYNISEGGEGGNTWSAHSEEDKKLISLKLRESLKNRVWINNGTENKWVKENEVDSFLNDGYQLGKLPLQDSVIAESKQKWKESYSHLIWITDGINNKRINTLKDSIDNYPSFHQGFTSKAKTKQEALEVSKKHKEKIISEYFLSPHYCEKCGKLITEYIGTGRFCSRSCAASHPHSQETKDLISKLNKTGIIGMKGKHLSPESKKKHSDANKKFYLNEENRIWINNGQSNKRIAESEWVNYQADGWVKGMLKAKKPVWNKGLTKETDERVKQISDNRIATMLLKYNTLNVYKINKDKKDEV